MKKLILASASPRRRELLSLLNVEFETMAPSVEDLPALTKGETPNALAERLALAKAKRCAQGAARGIVLGADTIVALGGGVLGKPQDPAKARKMLITLRGKRHEVVTGLALVDATIGGFTTAHTITYVTMRHYTDEEITEYIASGDPMDKAGAYGVQNQSFHPAALVEGCYLNVVGLPLCTLVEMLRSVGIEARPKSPSLLPKECQGCSLRSLDG